MTESSAEKRPPARIIAVANQKGGVGKTTTAINLGTGLAQLGYRCLLIDLDPQGNASTGLNSLSEDREWSTYHAISGQCDLVAAINETAVPNLSLAPASVDLSGIDVELVNDKKRAQRLASLISSPEDLREAYDFIIIDCPPSLNVLTVNAMVAANAVIVPLQCEFFALEGLTQLLATVRRVQQTLNPRLKIDGIVLTMFDRRNRLSTQVADDVRGTLGDAVYRTVIPRNVRLSEAPSHAMPALLYDPQCAGSRAYRALAEEVSGSRPKSDAA